MRSTPPISNGSDPQRIPFESNLEARVLRCSLCPLKKGGVCVEISDKAPFLLSGNNEDGCVVTVWSDPA